MEKRKISKYRNFAAQLALSESVLYMSPKLNDILDKIGDRWDSRIAKDLSNAIGTDIKPDVTFLDLSDKEGEITFTTMRNAKRKLDDIYPDDPEFVERIENLEKADISVSKQFWAKAAVKILKNDPEFWKAARNPIRVGKLVRQVLPGKYSDAEIEKFVNQYKSAVSPVSEMLLVQGNDIEKYYWHENYASMDGDLGNSCMAKKKGIFGIYTNNPEICKLLVMLDGYGKVKGRALVWKVGKNKEGIEWFMDRQYWNEQHDVDTFRAYAKEKGWAYKTNNNHYDQKVTWQDTNKYIDLSVSLKEIDGSYEYVKYPYMDTFKRYDPADGTLYNDDSEDDNEGQYLLQQTNGDYTEIESGVWSEWHGRTIPRDEAVWSEPYDDWLRENSAIYIEGRGYYHEDDDCLVYCEWDDRTLHEDDCVYSDDTSEWINKDRAVRGVYEIDEDGDIKTSWYDERDDKLLEINQWMRWHQVMSSKNTQWRDVEKIHQDISEKWANRDAVDIDGTVFPSIFKRFVYSLRGISENPRLPKEYMQEFLESGTQLSIKDCKMLGFEYVKEADCDPEDLWIVDDFEYHKRLSEAGPEGDSLLSRMIDLLVNDLIPNAEKMPDDGGEDMEQTYKDRLDRIWGMMPDEYQG